MTQAAARKSENQIKLQYKYALIMNKFIPKNGTITGLLVRAFCVFTAPKVLSVMDNDCIFAFKGIFDKRYKSN